MNMSDMNRAKLRALRDDVLNGRDITKSDVVFLLKVISFLETDNKVLSETLDRRDIRKPINDNYISKDKILKKLKLIREEYYKLFTQNLSLDTMNINSYRFDAMSQVLEELLKGI